jgi:hypothetical protein
LVRAFAGPEYEYACCLARDIVRAARMELLATVKPGREDEARQIILRCEGAGAVK